MLRIALGVRPRIFLGSAAVGLTPVLCAAVLACCVSFAHAQKWPERPVRVIVPLAPGGAIDFIARAVGERMSTTIGQQIVVENRTGAGGGSAWTPR